MKPTSILMISMRIQYNYHSVHSACLAPCRWYDNTRCFARRTNELHVVAWWSSKHHFPTSVSAWQQATWPNKHNRKHEADHTHDESQQIQLNCDWAMASLKWKVCFFNNIQPSSDNKPSNTCHWAILIIPPLFAWMRGHKVDPIVGRGLLS